MKRWKFERGNGNLFIGREKRSDSKRKRKRIMTCGL